jgi:lactoylglutathione lyase
MKLNHVNLTVRDAAETGAFLQKYFGLRPIAGGKMTSRFGVLYDDDGLVLTLIKSDRPDEVKYPSTFHIGFIQPSNEKVDEINRRLKDDGFDVPPPGKAHGAWTFYFQAPGGFMIEVLC